MIKSLSFLFLAVALSVEAQTNTPSPSAPPHSSGTLSVQEVLVSGPPTLKLHALSMLSQGRVKNVDDSFLPGFKACSSDPIMPIRSITAQMLGKYFVQGQETPNPEAVALLMQLAKDPSADVRYNAVYHGLTQIQNKSPEMLSFLLDFAAKNREYTLYARVIDSLKTQQKESVQILDKELVKGTRVDLYEIYEDVAGQPAPHPEKYAELPSSRPYVYILKPKNPDPQRSPEELKKNLQAAGLQNPDLFTPKPDSAEILLVRTYLTKDRLAVKKCFSDPDGAFQITQEMWLTPQLAAQLDAFRKNLSTQEKKGTP